MAKDELDSLDYYFDTAVYRRGFVIGLSAQIENMLTDIQDIINQGLYSMAVMTSAPNFMATEGETRLYVSGSIKRLYIFLNGLWTFIPITNKDEISEWGFVTGNGASPSQGISVTFSATFATAPLVFVELIGSRLVTDGTPTSPDWFTADATYLGSSVYAITTTGFSISFFATNGTSNIPATYNYGFVWRALL